jgi:cell fate regulator YaaT (PSP1 superfamily)
MGCSTCATTEGNKPGGCQNNGTCGTSGCNKLNVYNWLADMALPDNHQPFDIVEVRFKGSRKEFFRNVNKVPLREGDVVAVEGNPGLDIGTVSIAGELVRLQLRKKGIAENAPELKSLYRLAKGYDLEKWAEVKALEISTMYESRTIAIELGLQMKLSDVEYQGDGKKATFFYTADERVDFRELIKRLADKYKTRIEMRQIGLRQEASRLGGIGSCGRELCCSTWLTEFKAVTTSAARYQNLSLNQIKLAGQCGKLKCCLNFELDSYLDAIKDFPDTSIKLELKNGYARHVKTDIFKGIMWYSFNSNERKDEFQFAANTWVQLSVERIKEIIALNKKSIKPDELKTDIEVITKEKLLDYENVVGQDSITRLDKKKKKKKKKSNSQPVSADASLTSTTSATPQMPKPKPGQQQTQQPNKNQGQAQKQKPQTTPQQKPAVKQQQRQQKPTDTDPQPQKPKQPQQKPQPKQPQVPQAETPAKPPITRQRLTPPSENI